MSKDSLWKVRCSSNRKTGDGENIGKDPSQPKIPERWGDPSTYWFVNAEVLAETKEDAIKKVSDSKYPIEPLENPKVVKVNDVID